jgi:uncharacterized MAPEG superfamily protein
MNILLDNPAFRTYVICATILAVHLILLAGWTGTVRATRKAFVNPEDARLNKGTEVDSDHPDVRRAGRAHMNALENAVPFFIVGLLYVLTGATKTGAMAYFGTFTAARLLHSIFYLAGKQPFRTISFGIGVLTIFGMAFHVVRAAL